MTTIQKNEYVFEVDVEKTIDYYKTHSLCECECCENFYAQIKGKFPKLEAFLLDFGVDISKPDEMASVELDNTIQYIGIDYTVCGKVSTMGEYEIDIHDNLFFSLVITEGFASPNQQTGEYFTISIHNIFELPWVLDKPFPTPIQQKTLKSSYEVMKLNIDQKKRILFLAVIMLLLLSSIVGSVFSKEIALLIIVPLLGVWFVLYKKWWKCPHCNKSLGRLERGVTHCKYCGNKLSDD